MKTLEDIHNSTNESLVKNIGIGKTTYFEKWCKDYNIKWRNEKYATEEGKEYVIEGNKIIIQSTMTFYNDNDFDEIEIPDFIELDERKSGVYISNCPRILKAKYIPDLRICRNSHNDAFIDAEVGNIQFEKAGYGSSYLPGVKKAKNIVVKDFLTKATSCGDINCDKFVFDKYNDWDDSFIEEFKKHVHYKKITIKDKSFVLNEITKIDANSSNEDILVHLDIPAPSPTTDVFGNTLSAGDFIYFGKKGDWANVDRISFGIILSISGGAVSIKTTQNDNTSKFNKLTNAKTASCNCIKIDKNRFLKEAKFKF